MQDLEFTIQSGKLFMLQTRTGKRTGKAMVKVAVDLVAEGKLAPKEAVMRIDAAKLDEVLHPTIDPKARPTAIAKGLPASPGAAIGRVVFTAKTAEEWAAKGETVLLVRTDTSPEDIHGMKAAVGILTARGGMTSHSAVVARGMGKCCITACSTLRVDAAKKTAVFTGGGKELKLKEGDLLTLDGSTGEVFLGQAPLVPAQLGDEVGKLMEWVDSFRKLKVRTNADTPTDARTARSFGAEGIGLCRTEHMFFQPERITRGARDDRRERRSWHWRAALAKILPMQRGDFAELFRVMHGLPVTIRLLDPWPWPLCTSSCRTRRARSTKVAHAPRQDARSKVGPRRSRADRGEPDARPSRRRPRDHIPEIYAEIQSAARSTRGGGRAGRRRRHSRRARDHDPARRRMVPRGAAAGCAGARVDRDGRSDGAARTEHRVHDRHDDRIGCRARAWSPIGSPSTPTSSRSARTT